MVCYNLYLPDMYASIRSSVNHKYTLLDFSQFFIHNSISQMMMIKSTKFVVNELSDSTNIPLYNFNNDEYTQTDVLTTLDLKRVKRF